MMLRADSPAELLVAPVGRYVRGRSFLFWVQSPERLGAFHFGPLDSSDHPALAALFPLFGHPDLAERFDMLHDLSAVETFDQRSFDFFEQFLAGMIDYLARRTRRLAVVRPGGLPGAAFSGMYHEWVASRFDASLCVEAGQAHDWLGLPEGSPERAELDGLRDLFSPSPLLRMVREAIAYDLREATLTSVSEALGLTPRTLQRQLTGARSSFRDEIVRARIRAAEAMLLDGDDKIERIAHEVGFQSTAAFTKMFQRLEGEPPSVFRSRRRQAS